jgi:branched-chain amino acid transport system substrate-binding protein
MRTRKNARFAGATVCVGIALVGALAGCSSSGGTSDSTSPTASVAGAGSPVAGTKSPLKVGWVGSTAGVSAATGGGALAGVKAWVSAVNAKGGINGHPVELVVKDDQNDPAQGLSAVKSLVQDDHVIALVGVHANVSEGAWASYVQTAGIPIVGGESDTPVWITNPMFFASGEPGTSTLDSEAYLAKAIGKKSFGSINVGQIQDTAPLIKLLEQATAKYGVNYAFHAVVSPSAPNYTANCLAAKNSGADVVALNLDPNTLARLTSDCARQQIKLTYLIPSGAFGGVSLDDSNLDGTYIPTNNFLWFAGTPAAEEFRAAMAKYQPDAKLDPNSTQGWSGGKLFEAAAQHLPDNATAADVLKGLYAIPANDTLGGVSPGNTFTKGKPVTTPNCFFLAQIGGGKLSAPQGTDPICPSA